MVLDPYKELFIWAVLSNLGEMAVCLWRYGKEPLVKALVGRMLFEEMVEKSEAAHISDDVLDKIKLNSKYVKTIILVKHTPFSSILAIFCVYQAKCKCVAHW